MPRKTYDRVVLIRVTRGGKDPTITYYIVSEALANTLDSRDPIKIFANKPEGLVDQIFQSRKEAVGYCREHHMRVFQTIHAIGY